MITHQAYVSIDVFQYALPWWQLTGLMTTDTLYFLYLSELAFGAVFQAARTYFLLKQNRYSIGTFKEKSFVGNYISNSLHLTLAMIACPLCRQQIQKYAVYMRHRCLPGVGS